MPSGRRTGARHSAPRPSRPALRAAPPAGFVSIFNGKDLTGWKIPEGDGGHWKVLDAAACEAAVPRAAGAPAPQSTGACIDYDASSMAKDKNLWTVKILQELRADGRLAHQGNAVHRQEHENRHAGRHEREDSQGREINLVAPDSDSGIVPRGFGKAQFNIWNWPVGSGEMYGYRTAKDATPEQRRNATPRMNADKNIGE